MSSPIHLPRLFLSIIYDTIILMALIFIAAQWFPLIPDHLQQRIDVTVFKQTYIITICFLYFALSWRHGGQTIGMKSWRIKCVDENDISQAISWKQSMIRFCVAIISWLVVGLGFIWLYLNSQNRTWHDMASSTQLIILPK